MMEQCMDHDKKDPQNKKPFIKFLIGVVLFITFLELVNLWMRTN